MALPKAVQQQAEEADRIAAGLQGEEPGKQPETSTESQSIDPVPQANEVIPNEPQQVNQIPEETWERKYHVLQGKFEAEVPRLHADLREMKAQQQQFLTEQASLRAKAEQRQPEPVKSLVTEQDKEAFGSDLLDLIDRATESKVQTFRQREAELVSQIDRINEQLGSVSSRQGVSDQDRFLMSLGQRVPEWEQLNTDPAFLQWLGEVDAVYGIPRQMALTSAAEAFDSNRVATIFNAYKATLAPTSQQNKPKPSEQLQSQVTPTRSMAQATTTATESSFKLWSNSDVERFYSDKRRGFLSTEEAARIEQEIQSAISEGRVR